MSDVIGFIVNLTDLYILYMVMRNFCKRRFQYRFPLYIGGFIISLIITLVKVYVTNSLLSMAISLLILFGLFTLFYKNIRSVAVSLIVWAITSQCIEWLVIFSLSALFRINFIAVFYNISWMPMVAVFISIFLKYVVMYVWLGRKKKGHLDRTFSFYQLIFFALSILVVSNTTILFYYLIDGTAVSEWFISYFFICITLLFISVLYLFDKLLSITKKNEESQLVMQRQNLHEKFFDEIYLLIDQLKFLGHDYKLHLQYLQNLSQTSEKKEMTDYVNQLLKESKNVSLGFIENQQALSLQLLQKAKLAKEKNITFECKVPERLETDMSETHLNVIVGNLLDNAFEAVEKLESDRLVKVDIYQVNDMFFINIGNTYNGKLNIWNKDYQTTKKNTQYHGFGIKSVKSLVEDYDGVCKISTTDNHFQVMVALPLIVE